MEKQKAKRTNKKYSSEFKLSVILDMRDNILSYRETMRKYFPHLGEANFGFLKMWERIYWEEGAEGLMKERRGRITKADNPKKGRQPKLDKQVEEDLIAEVQRLRAENDYLKKLDALVSERKKRENPKKS